MANVHLRKAESIIEGVRFKIGCEVFLIEFVHQWAYLHTGLYQPTTSTQSDAVFIENARNLSNELNQIMLSGKCHSPLTELLSIFHTSAKHNHAFFATPKGVSQLMTNLLMSPEPSYRQSIYEPCCGPSGISFEAILAIVEENYTESNPLQGVTLVVEDINSVAIKAYLLQLVHLLAFLSESLGREVRPDTVSIKQINVLTRSEGGINYHLSSPESPEVVEKIVNPLDSLCEA